MKETLLTTDKTSGPQAGAQLARLGPVHGYRFDGDLVSLNAMFTVLNSEAHQKNWALQLWACPTAPSSAADLRGHLVAESPLPPIGEVADEHENFELTATAVPPAGAGEYFMVLSLVSGRRGQYDEVQDLAVYPLTEHFIQPAIQGAVGFQIEADRVQINIDRIANRRGATNLSGTLAVELWALSRPYTGGSFDGVCLAGIAIGSLAGQTETAAESFDLIYNRPPAGTWNVTLMLREWTAAGYVTRDYVNFNIPLTYQAVVEAVQPAITPAPVAAPKAVAVEAKAPVARVIAPIGLAEVKAPVKTPVVGTKAATKAASSATKPAQRIAAIKSAALAGPALVSINSAKLEDLAAVKGLPKNVAEGIVKKRPFKSIDDLINVKGMGAKLLAKLRSQFKI